MGIGSKCVSEDFQELSFSNFQAFLRRGCTSFDLYLSNLDNSPHLQLTVPKHFYLMHSHVIHAVCLIACCPSETTLMLVTKVS